MQVSVSAFPWQNCEWLIKTVTVYAVIHPYMDNRGKSRANTCFEPDFAERLLSLDTEPTQALPGAKVNHNGLANRKASAGDGVLKFLTYQLPTLGTSSKPICEYRLEGKSGASSRGNSSSNSVY